MVIGILMILLCAFIVGLLLYDIFGFFKHFYHDILGWHTPDPAFTKYDESGIRVSRCKHCGCDLVEDYKGNWN
jgi:hypothetical protein